MSRQKSTKDVKKETPKKTVSISIPKGFEDEVAYLSEQPNKSQYIWGLVRDDMKRQSEDNQILEIVRQAMQNITLGASVNNLSQQKTHVNNFSEDKRKKGALSILQD